MKLRKSVKCVRTAYSTKPGFFLTYAGDTVATLPPGFDLSDHSFPAPSSNKFSCRLPHSGGLICHIFSFDDALTGTIPVPLSLSSSIIPGS
jgi:hypothetical protein